MVHVVSDFKKFVYSKSPNIRWEFLKQRFYRIYWDESDEKFKIERKIYRVVDDDFVEDCFYLHDSGFGLMNMKNATDEDLIVAVGGEFLKMLYFQDGLLYYVEDLEDSSRNIILAFIKKGVVSPEKMIKFLSL